MSPREVEHDQGNDATALRISLASPYDIRSWSFGEVKNSQTFNRLTSQPETNGLFCQRIFGPVKDWECACGKYRGQECKGIVCDRCGVLVGDSRIRRQRMGHIELAAPVVHIWFLRVKPSPLAVLLNMKSSSLEKIISFRDYVVIDPGATPLERLQLLTPEQEREAREIYGYAYRAETGADAIKKLLEDLNPSALAEQLRQELLAEERKWEPSRRKLRSLSRRLDAVQALCNSTHGRERNRPDWMVLDCLPVIPPGLRPVKPGQGNNSSNLNGHYRRIINCNNRLKYLVDLNAPDAVILNEKRRLQQAVDALFESRRWKRLFRRQFSSGRAAHSCRSVIVPGPGLRLCQCGLPREIALQLFQPFLLRRLKELGLADSVQSARQIVAGRDDQLWTALEDVTRNHPVLLSAGKTLHRMGVQAFEPVLLDGNAVRVHPLVFQSFQVSSGDPITVHLPFSTEARTEAAVLLAASNNLFSPANGQMLLTPTQDIVMGCYHLTATRGELGESGEPGEGKVFAGVQEVLAAFDQDKLGVHARIRVRLPLQKKVISEVSIDREKVKVDVVDRESNGLVWTTVGRVMFNEVLSTEMAFYDVGLTSRQLQRILSDCQEQLGPRETLDLLERIKEIGFREATCSGLSFAIGDLLIPANKEKVFHTTEKQLAYFRRQYDEGNITDSERSNRVIDLWTHARDEITKQIMIDLRRDRRKDEKGVERPYLNPVFLMAHSGARGGTEQIRQLAGMRGLMAKPNGTIIETPVKHNLREGPAPWSISARFTEAATSESRWQPAGRTRIG